MRIEGKILEEIISTIGKFEPETGGVLGMRGGVVCAFYFDKNSVRRTDEYCPNTQDINSVLAGWSGEGVSFGGIIHSHPNGCCLLSGGDREGIEAIVKAIPPMDELYFPVVTNEGGAFSMSVYRVTGAKERICIDEVSYEVLG